MATSTISLIMAVASAAVIVAALVARAAHRARRSGDARPAGVLGAGDVVLALLVAAVLLVGQLAVSPVLGFDVWDLMSVVYLDVVVAVPLVAAVLLAGHALRRTVPAPALSRGAAVACVVALVPAAVGVYASRIGPFALEVEEVVLALPDDRDGDRPVRIGVLADIQTVAVGPHERRAVDELMARRPDVVLVAGDVFQGSPAQLDRHREALRDLFRRMDAPGGVWVVPGDVDWPMSLVELLDGTPARLLHDEVVVTTVEDRTIVVGGVSLGWRPEGGEVVRRLRERPPGSVGILLAHRPDWVFEVPDGAVDLVVAGHTHGGQVQLPGIGPLMTLTAVPRQVAGGGLHEVHGTPIYVSTGIGREQQGAPQIRFLADPSVGVVELR